MIKIPILEPQLGKEELDSAISAIKSGWISSKGKFIGEFENNFSKYCNMHYGVATSNGTTALHLALTALGIKEGDEVIVPDLTFPATANAVIYCGAKPVFVDIDREHWCIDVDKITEKITEKTKAIIPVHIYGHPCDMDAILKISRKNNLFVVEDCAEAHGAKYRGKMVGSFGDIGCFSFFGNKMITTGEGGICVTNSKKLSEKMRILRDHGMNPTKKYWHDVVGFNYRMTNIQAAIGLAQLKKLDRFIEKKKQIAGWYSNGLKNMINAGQIKLQTEMPWAEHVYWLYSILINKSFGIDGKKLTEILLNKGIETRRIFYPLHVMPPYKEGGSKMFPISNMISERGLSLPSSVTLKKKEVESICREIGRVAGTIKLN